MSHLSLDARAILHHLNELGYRNITAEQLKEFLKGMQPKPDQSSKSSKHRTTIISTTTTTTPAAASTVYYQNQQKQQQQPKDDFPTTTISSPSQKSLKIIKSKRPLCQFKFYLDICDHQLTKRIEEHIKTLGGNLEFFLTESVTHFITDKTVKPSLGHNSRPGTPQTPATPITPQTPYSSLDTINDARFNRGGGAGTPIGAAGLKTGLSRADAILNRARCQSNNIAAGYAAVATATTPIKNSRIAVGATAHSSITGHKSPVVVQKPTYKIWQIEQALSFFKKVSIELRDYLEKSSPADNRGSGVVSLKGTNFIKIEAINQNTRPYYHVIKKPDGWPKIDLTSEEGAFRFTLGDKPAFITTSVIANVTARSEVMTRMRMRSSQQSHQQQSKTLLTTADQVAKNTKTNLTQFNLRGKGETSHTTKNAPVYQDAEESLDKQCGVCEICKVEYDTLNLHLKTKEHVNFVKNPQNFIEFDQLIQSTVGLNKFLNEENLDRQQVTSENSAVIPEELDVEEMEVDESLCKVEDSINDPLDESPVSTSFFNTTRPNSAESLKRRPSPALREKSKRITKGKHSSEKFQSKTASAVKQSLANKSINPPQKKQTVSCMVELQRVSSVASPANAVTPATTRRKAATSAVISSPPIRAMLPPSTVYKVVETPEPCATTLRSRRNAIGADTAAPSIIVKFQKVRQNEVQRLNGEAENFMFPRTRSSSELHTDTDRQTTSSFSIDSTSELESTGGSLQDSQSSVRNDAGRRIAIPTRRRGGGTTATVPEQRQTNPSKGNNRSSSSSIQQRFQSTPIQPKRQLKSCSAMRTTSKASIASLPEATRKSSRTATAIVTKATTSSRLVRAQVEAAKQTSRQQQNAKVPVPVTQPVKSPPNTVALLEAPSKIMTPMNRPNKRRVVVVVKKEDRMGEKVAIQNKKPHIESLKDSISENDKDDDDDDDDDSDEIDGEEDVDDDDDDERDKDYVASKVIKKNSHMEATKLLVPLSESRDERAARRQARLNNLIKTEVADAVEENEEISEKHSSPSTKASKKLATPPRSINKEKVLPPPPKSKQTKNGCTLKSKAHLNQPAPHIFDFTKSECLSSMKYAFECLPTADLWHQVFTRQDAGEERYHTYFGQTKYRKLPYEFGPIPFNSTPGANNYCEMCNKTDSSTAITSECIKSKLDIKKELLNECEEQAHESSSSSVIPTNKDQQEENKGGGVLYKHKKLHLLQRYQQEQAVQEQQQIDTVMNTSLKTEQKVVPVVKPNPVAEIAQPSISHFVNTAISKCDSKASTPELFDREFVPLSELATTERIRADSTHSNTSSSYASSTASHSKKAFRNKHLNRIAELPPRKSPREHASTLALVSCIIRQRQDSLSKTNSEIDEPPTTPTHTVETNVISKLEEETATTENATKKPADIVSQPPTTPIKQNSPTPLEKQKQVASPRTTRSAAATPIEELRFTTEISENVKRMRRGQNKYDHSPPFVYNTTRRGRRTTQIPLGSTNSATLSRRLVMAAKQDLPASVALGKRKRRDRLKPLHLVTKNRAAAFKNTNIAANTTTNGLNMPMSGVRKLGTKKGVLEFEFDKSAMRRLDVAKQHSNPHFAAWVIDKYLELAGKEYDMEESQFDVATATDDNEITESEREENTAGNAISGLNTPPPTDCFTSEFDLYDLLSGTEPSNANAAAACGVEEETIRINNRRNSFCFYSSTSLQNYYRKKKSMKSNRTGWPKVQKRKASTRQQRLLDEKISFEKIGIGGRDLVQIKEEPLVMCDDKDEAEAEGDEEYDQINQDAQATNIVQTKKAANDDGAELEDDRGGGDDGVSDGVITPPATDDDDVNQNNIVGDNGIEQEAEDSVASCEEESLIEDDETVNDSIEIDEEGDDDDDENTTANDNDNLPEADIDATDADVEEDDDDEDDEQGEHMEDDDCATLPNVEEDDQFEDAYDHDANDVDIFDDAQEAVKKSIAKDSEFSADCLNSPNEKHNRLSPNISGSTHEEQHKVLISLLNAKPTNLSTSFLATSTPTSRQHHHNRRTPQLNGSLGSCGSPSEKMGDHNDIFTVSSDGLDTDLDVSNPHGQMKDDHEHRIEAHQCPHQTPKRKFDISKYAPGNAKASSCAAEAATAAAKSLAISQFLKKEVRVTCRRLRAPFRRFRYRR